MRKNREQSGFSLVEVLVVIAVLAILAGTLMGFGKRLKQQANEKLCKSTIAILVAALEQYYDYHGEFPVSIYIAPDLREGLLPIENLYNQLYSLSGTRKLCEQIQASQQGDTNGKDQITDKVWTEFLDPWGNALDYQTGVIDALGNLVPWTFPRITSGGPDGDLATTGDNVSSK